MKGLDVKRVLDKAELTQTIIIIAGFAVAATVTTGALSSTLMNKGEAAAGCIAHSSGFTSGGESKVKCEELNEKATESSRGAIVGNFGTPAQVDSHNKKTAMLKAQKEDLMNFAAVLENYKKEHGEYPLDKFSSMAKIPFKVDINNYPTDYQYNFDYCRTLDKKGYIVTVHTGTDELMYISSNNSTPKKYSLSKEYIEKTREETGSFVSACYSGTEWSASDRAGLSQVGVFDKEINNITVETRGTTGINTNAASGGWAVS